MMFTRDEHLGTQAGAMGSLGDRAPYGSGIGAQLLGACRWAPLLGLALLIILAQGCGSVPPRSNPLPEELSAESQVPGIPLARYWGDEAPPLAQQVMSASPSKLRKQFPSIYGR